MPDIYEQRTYNSGEIGFGEKPGIVVVDYMTAFTDPKYPLGGAPLIERGVQNSARLLDAARRAGVPIANCWTSYHSVREMPHWKVQAVREQFIHGAPGTELEPRIFDEGYDMGLCKSGPSIFFETVSYTHLTLPTKA